MQTLIISLIISLIFTIFFLVYSWRYKKHIELKIEKRVAIYTESTTTKEEPKDVLKEKLLKIAKIIAETEKYIEDDVKEKMKVVEAQSESFETELIEKGGKEYRLTTAGLMSALPKSKQELVEDLRNLSETLEKLGDLDQDLESEKKVDIGKGMFYEKMSRRFIKIIKENNLDKFDLIPIQQIKFHIFSSVKNLKNEDILPIFNLMKETNLIRDVIEINPQFYFIITKNLDVEFTNPEKVVLSFSYDYPNLKIEKLLELSQWDFQYTDKILSGLKQKGLIEVNNDDQIIVESFKDESEVKKWKEFINAQIQLEKEKQEEKEMRRQELKKKLRSQIEKVKKEVSDDLNNIAAPEQINEPSEAELPKIKFDKTPSVKKLPKKDITDDAKITTYKGSIDLDEAVSQRILRFHEKYSIINGGLVQFEKIENFILKKNPDIKKEIILATLNQLMDLSLVSSSLTLDEHLIFLFKDIELTQNEKDFISQALYRKPLSKDNFMKRLKWNEETILETMKLLQEKGIIRIEADKVVIPGIIQE
jgi:hypothetical protein